MSDTVGSEWHKCKAIYPPAAEIASALQDPGEGKTVKQKKKEVVKHKFPRVEKLAAKIYRAIQREFSNPEGLTSNVSRGKQVLHQSLIICRRAVDTSDTHPFFHEHGKDGKVFQIANNPETCGMEICIQRFQDHVNQAVKQKNTARTHNDALRLGCILLDPQCRGAVSGVMAKKKDRKKSDITGDPTTHFFEEALEKCFMNEDYEANPPAAVYHNEFAEEDKAGWDPNHPAIFQQERDGAWLKATWEEYLRPKYRKALDKWNKDTGGGDGTPTSFVDFCANDRWLAHLFCKDLQANFLIANSAGGRMPRHLQQESGFEMEVSSLSGSASGSSRAKLEDDLTDSVSHRKRVGDVLDKISGLIDTKVAKVAKSEETTKEEELDQCISKVADYSLKMQDPTTLESMSPNSRDTHASTLQRQRKNVLQRMAKKP